MRRENFSQITLVLPRGAPTADIFCEKNSERVCCEVKSITKQSTGRPNLFLEQQLYAKILESVSKAREQLNETARDLQCSVKIFACVLNWFSHSIYLGQSDYQHIVNKLEREGDLGYLHGIDGVWFVTKMGQRFLFLNEIGKRIDC